MTPNYQTGQLMTDQIETLAGEVGSGPNSESAKVRKMLRPKVVRELTGLSNMTLYRMVKDGIFPAPVALSNRRFGPVAFYADEIAAWQENRPRQRPAVKPAQWATSPAAKKYGEPMTTEKTTPKLELKDVPGYPDLGKIEIGGHTFCFERGQLEPIVRAVNCHDEMLNALQRIVLEFGNRGETTSLDVWNKRMKTAIEEARVAIALAKASRP